mgnify:CR=1 FL=1
MEPIGDDSAVTFRFGAAHIGVEEFGRVIAPFIGGRGETPDTGLGEELIFQGRGGDEGNAGFVRPQHSLRGYRPRRPRGGK